MKKVLLDARRPSEVPESLRIASEKPIAGSDVWEMAMLWSGVVTEEARQQDRSVGGRGARSTAWPA